MGIGTGGATIIINGITFTFQGTWSAGTYAANSAVRYGTGATGGIYATTEETALEPGNAPWVHSVKDSVVAGPQGDPGTDAAEIIFGATDPVDDPGGTGVDGDIYIMTADDGFLEGDVLQKEAGAWSLKGNMKGPAGSNGSNGADGANGQGVPTGGTAAQLLSKIDATDFNTEWVDPPAGGGLSLGDATQLFASSPSKSCMNTQQACGAITATVVVTGGNAVLTCSADARQYIGFLSVVSTLAQVGKAALVSSISNDGLTITCTGIGEDNPLVTDAVASALKFYGAPAAVVGNAVDMAPIVIYNYDDSAGGATAFIREGYWTGPMFTAGKWFSGGGTVTGLHVKSLVSMAAIVSINSHALGLQTVRTSSHTVASYDYALINANPKTLTTSYADLTGTLDLDTTKSYMIVADIYEDYSAVSAVTDSQSVFDIVTNGGVLGEEQVATRLKAVPTEKVGGVTTLIWFIAGGGATTVKLQGKLSASVTGDWNLTKGPSGITTGIKAIQF